MLVDTVVTDKKGAYIRDLKQSDFRVFEDNKEQPIKSFSFETDAANDNRKHYMVMFFDNSTMDIGDQGKARDAAMKFLDANTGANRYIAVVDFGGTLRITQNFTSDAARLRDVVRNLKFSSVAPTPAVASTGPIPAPTFGIPQLVDPEADFGVRTLLLALRNLAKGIATVPGRKTLVLFSSGFPMDPTDPNTPERYSELTAAINACNKANVAVYPIDVRGLITPLGEAPGLQIFPDAPARLESATLDLGNDSAAHLVYVQRRRQRRRRRRGGGGGHRRGYRNRRNGYGRTYQRGQPGPVVHVPVAEESSGRWARESFAGGALTARLIRTAPLRLRRDNNQEALYQLANGTGGFVIVNTNDLLGGLQKIANEQNEYYVLGYTPPPSDEGSCHVLKVKLDRGGTVVRSRSGYCNVRPADLLAGKPVEKQLESQATGSQPGTVAASMRAPYFYTSANTARVNLAIEIPSSAIKFGKEKGKEHAELNVIGLAYAVDGTIAARFSDNVEFNFEARIEIKEFPKKPYVYENQFEMGAGHYDLKVAFGTGGQNFGKLEIPLVVDGYDTKQFSMSAVALSKELRPLKQDSTGLDAALLEDRTPLVAQGMEIVPAGSDHFKKSDPATFYIEIYDPLLTSATPPNVRVEIRVIDRKTGEQKVQLGGPAPGVKAGDPVIALGVKLPMDKLAPGSYRLELKAADSAGNSTAARTADFEVE